MHRVPVYCQPRDYAVFRPPAGQTCDPHATDRCAYCEYSVADDYTVTLDFAYSDRWWNWAVFLAFCLTNYVLVFAGTGILRVKLRQWKARARGRRKTALGG
ncbi:uncharacterized protein BO66DRAFT_403746 [Aspergillus aculeatinus CBS 121060]|uniref:Uncharacterized protein n=1 Tax=Aspergillus aculeatinus CBS 121060 TaxID=1448322 RepID=A0ACD1H1W5_9EURO|nr:hypothetical protein BO66DRAFT_403746 [Aspergillus aculeatinus CBS 121060]RAH67555.1 hypothetical protein BO66DRAFT_403746 [Aspergillus aculeatinus CBS 121060]